MSSGATFIVGPSTSRGHGNEGGYCGTAQGGAVPQNLHPEARERQVSSEGCFASSLESTPFFQHPLRGHLRVHDPLGPVHRRGARAHPERAVRQVRSSRRRAPLPQDQAPGGLLLLRLRAPGGASRSRTLHGRDGPRHDRRHRPRQGGHAGG